MDTKKYKNTYRIESTRLKGYNYSQKGIYFVTICTKNREHLLGEIENGMLTETEQSRICDKCWYDLPNHYSNCQLDAFIIMPNHIHGIIVIQNPAVETGLKPVSTIDTATNEKQYSLSEIIRGFKTFTARKINEFQKTAGLPFWQSRFYDRIIRDERELYIVQQYIINNPKNWKEDTLYFNK